MPKFQILMAPISTSQATGTMVRQWMIAATTISESAVRSTLFLSVLWGCLVGEDGLKNQVGKAAIDEY
jgi:hypothetical protein